jgi:hypothetical protein
MSRFHKQILMLALLMVAMAPAVKAFSLLGPLKPWQDTRKGYNLPGDIGGPMGRDEEFRWNTPVLTYAFDKSFLEYFGVRGVEAIEAAFAILNALPPASEMSPNLTEFAQTDMLRRNHQAFALGLLDLKSVALERLVEQLGLADPVRWTWTLRGLEPRTVGGVTTTNYTVIQLNFDPVTLAPTHAVNGTLYGYTIFDRMTTVGQVAEPIEIPLDLVPNSSGNPAPVAGFGAGIGDFWIGLTRDDVGGLRHIYRTNNINNEEILPGSLLAVTNLSQQLIVTNRDLRTFELQTSSTTNTPAAILALYPDIEITSTNARLAVRVQTNILSFFTNIPPVQVTQTNLTTNIVTLFDYTFGNVRTNLAEGSFFIMPPNVFDFVNRVDLLTEVVTVTNITPTLNVFVNTNLQTLLSTIDLVTFSRQATTNDPAALLAIHPTLAIASTNMQILPAAETNFSFYLTNYPWAPAGTPPTVVFVPELTNVLITNWSYTFFNVVTNTFLDSGPVSIQRMEVSPAPFAPVGSGLLITNFSSRTYMSNFVNGTVYIIPTNVVGFQFVRTVQTNVNVISNNLNPTVFGTTFLGTNLTNVVITNFPATNLVASFTNLAEIILQTNFIYAVHPVVPGSTLVESVSQFTNVISGVHAVEFQPSTNTLALRQGVDKLHFLRVNFDSLIGNAFTPITNQFTDTIITNSRPVSQVVRRIIRQPDILFVAEDLGLVGNLVPVLTRRSTTTNWVSHAAVNGVGGEMGPGVITPPIRLLFTTQLPYFAHFANQFSSFLDFDPTFSNRSVVWGSFDGTTNAPVVYPDFLSIQLLENLILNPSP